MKCPEKRCVFVTSLTLSAVLVGGGNCPSPPTPPPVPQEPVPIVELLEEYYGPIIYDPDVELPFSEISIDTLTSGAGYGCLECYNPNCWAFLPVGRPWCLQQFEIVAGLRRQSACIASSSFDCVM